jgi:hypothetical protein
VLKRLWQTLEPHRMRIAKGVALLFLFSVGGELLGAYPRDVELELDLGPEHAAIRELRVAYVQDGDELHGVRLTYPDGAPERVRHRTKLGPGRYELRVEIGRTQGGPTRTESHSLQVPSEGTIHVTLGAPAPRARRAEPSPARRASPGAALAEPGPIPAAIFGYAPAAFRWSV